MTRTARSVWVRRGILPVGLRWCRRKPAGGRRLRSQDGGVSASIANLREFVVGLAGQHACTRAQVAILMAGQLTWPIPTTREAMR